MILKFIYELLENASGIEVQYNDGMEYLVGIFLSAIAIGIIGDIMYRIAYKQTGRYARAYGIYDSGMMRYIHYGIRILLLAIAIIIVYPILQKLINLSVPSITETIMNSFYKLGQGFTDLLVKPFLDHLQDLAQ